MVRWRVRRRCRCLPGAGFFKPRGVPLRCLDEVLVERDELEALKLHDADGLDQKAAAGKMGISQPTFARILNRVYKKVAVALVEGKAIRLSS